MATNKDCMILEGDDGLKIQKLGEDNLLVIDSEQDDESGDYSLKLLNFK